MGQADQPLRDGQGPPNAPRGPAVTGVSGGHCGRMASCGCADFEVRCADYLQLAGL